MEKRAFTLSDFCTRYGIGRTKAYDEIASGRLRAVKVGRRTLVTESDAETWLVALPKIGIEPRRDLSGSASKAEPTLVDTAKTVAGNHGDRR
jgi:excisionase family DNA binding protein